MNAQQRRAEPSRAGTSNGSRPTVQQPKPQAISHQGVGATILVSTRQKGNPILNHVRGMPWEYADIPADYVVGATTCALFLSLKYHKLHPEYIYGRIRALQGKYTLRILLTMVDIEAHEEALKELSKTSLINNVTVILAWSAAEAGRYLELFKTYEHAAPTSIKGHQSTNFSDRLVEFVTVPRSVNKTDALGLVSNFGTIRTAVNAQADDINLIAGWGDKKVQRWCNAVREPFRSEKAARKVLSIERTESGAVPSFNREDSNVEVVRPSTRVTVTSAAIAGSTKEAAPSEEAPVEAPTTGVTPLQPAGTSNIAAGRKRPLEPEVSGGVLDALAKLREGG